MAEIIWKVDALSDLQDQLSYYRKHSPGFAQKLNDSVLTRVSHLRHSPRMGRVVPEWNDEAVRELIVPPLRVIYVITPDDRCYVSAIMHSSRDLASRLHPEDLKTNTE